MDSPGFERRSCPYFFCSAVVIVANAPTMDGKVRRIIKRHTIVHPLLQNGDCIASLTYLPTDDATQRLYDQREVADSRLINIAMAYRNPFPAGKPDVSTSLRTPRRIGREPEPNSPDWALGGRADEDVQPAITFERPRPPMGVLGREMGKHVATVQELLADLQEAALKGGEAIGGLQGMQNTLEEVLAGIGEARSIVYRMSEGQESGVLIEYASLLSNAHLEAAALSARLEEIKNIITAAQEKGDDFKGRLLG